MASEYDGMVKPEELSLDDRCRGLAKWVVTGNDSMPARLPLATELIPWQRELCVRVYHAMKQYAELVVAEVEDQRC